MFSISGTTISITRADTGIFTLDIANSQGQPYDYSNDEVLFTVKKNVYEKTALIQKEVQYGENITILPSDTEKLSYGAYVYDVQITTAGGVVDTVRPPSQFVILPEVTF